MKCVYILALILTIAYGDEADWRKIDSVMQEAKCREAGGMCVVSRDCPEGSLSETLGLCPQQQDQGIECCYGMSVKETRCENLGGHCIPGSQFCGPTVTSAYCPGDQKCCMLL
ncbi:U-scoloptoxin(19)-Tl1a isoform X2 [Epargyreus clarus]|uniref:U-scoloptoxin(19)-Tl1a isoform X2 n=1 Tax=Epargyreus clarus TaxID=520877 RepID=UPI003C303AA1